MRSNLLKWVMWCGLVAVTSPTSADEHKPTAKPSTCRASDFALDELMSHHQRSGVYIVGRVVNNCDHDTGVQIKVAILDHAGGVMRVANFWPASTENIPAHSGWPFQAEMDGVDSFDRFQVTVIDVKRWIE